MRAMAQTGTVVLLFGALSRQHWLCVKLEGGPVQGIMLSLNRIAHIRRVDAQAGSLATGSVRSSCLAAEHNGRRCSNDGCARLTL